jgi:hypothetical protein
MAPLVGGVAFLRPNGPRPNPEIPLTGREARSGHDNGYRNADALAERLHAKRLSRQNNEFAMGGRRVLLKTGDRGAVASGATLDRVDAVIYAYQDHDRWCAFELEPGQFRSHGVPSQSTSHQGRDYLQLSKTQCTEVGRRILG